MPLPRDDRPWTEPVSFLASGPRGDRVLPALAGFLWLVPRVRSYPTGYLFVPSPDILVVQAATWLALLAGAAAVALALWIPVRLFGADRADGAGGPLPAAWPVAAVFLLGLAPRLAWLDLIPQGVWVDGVHALKAAAQDGRFFGPHEGRLLLPPEFGPSRVTVCGLYLDFLRVLLLATGDRLQAHLLMSFLPGILIPAGVFLLARRVATGSAPFLAGAAAAAGLWPLVLARWGWDQQLMSLLLLLALERLVHGLDEGRRGPLLAGGLLAGLACHTSIGGWLGAAGILCWVMLEARLARSRARLLWPAAGLLAALLPLAVYYVSHPHLAGGRITETRLTGSAGVVARDLTLNVLDYAGEFFFTADPNQRHGLREPYFPPILVGSLVLGLAALFRGGDRGRTGRRGLVALFAMTLAGGVLSSANAAPSGYRTGLAGALAFIPIGVGLAQVTASKVWSPRGRMLLSALLPALVVVTEWSRFLAWGLPERGAPAFSPRASAAGRFLRQVPAGRVLVDPAVFQEDASSPYVASIHVNPGDSLSPLLPLRIGTPASLPATSGLDWYVTLASAAPRQRPLHLGFPGGPDRDVVAVRIR